MESDCDYDPVLAIDILLYHGRYSDLCLLFEVSASASDHIHTLDRPDGVVLRTLVSRHLLLVVVILYNLDTSIISIIQGTVHFHSIVYPAANYGNLAMMKRSCDSHLREFRRRTW